MINLYKLNDEIQGIDWMLESWAKDHDGDITDFPLFDALEKLEGDKKQRLLDLAVYIKNLSAEAKAYKEEKNRLQAIEKAINNKIDRIRNYIEDNITSDEQFKDTRATITWRESKRVVVECMLDELPEEYVKIEKTARLKELGELIKSGCFIDGVSIQTFNNLQIK